MRQLNLVAPLAQEATAMCTKETDSNKLDRSCTVAQVIGESLRPGDVDSANQHSTPLTTPLFRISTMATRTTTIRTISTERELSADTSNESHTGFLLEDIVQAYFDCRKHKRNTNSAMQFEIHLEKNLIRLHDELNNGTYQPGRSICFIITRPKPREVWAADFRDRIVHHLLYNHVSPRFYASFIVDSCACIPGRGTLYAAKRLESKIRSQTQNWSKPAYYLKCDLANFFVSINKEILFTLLAKRITEPLWLALAELILFHDPRQNYQLRGNPALVQKVPTHKQLVNQSSDCGLPIGNLSSQFFANVLLDELDQFIKHTLRAKHYVRYVDDFVLMHESAQQLNEWLAKISAFLPERLDLELNQKKTIIQPVDRGVDFVGQVIKPWRRTTRRRTLKAAIKRVKAIDTAHLRETANSYYGLLRQASHSYNDRIKLTKAVFTHGKSVDFKLTKILQGSK